MSDNFAENASVGTEVKDEAEELREELRKLIAEGEADIAERKKKLEDAITGAQEAKRLAEEAKTGAETARTATEAEKTTTEQLRGQTDDFLTKARENQKATQGLAVRAGTIEASLNNYEKDLDGKGGKYDSLHEKIEGLLPGGTSVGLAQAFMECKLEYRLPKRVWSAVFVSSVVAMVCLALFGPSGAFAIASTLQEGSEALLSEILKGLAWRIPVAAPLVWLAIYSSRHHMLNLRLEEDYRYKEAVSRSFEGYKREMGSVDSKALVNPLGNLCNRALSALGAFPGRIYDKKHTDITPLHTLVDAINPKELASLAGINADQARKVIEALTERLK